MVDRNKERKNKVTAGDHVQITHSRHPELPVGSVHTVTAVNHSGGVTIKHSGNDYYYYLSSEEYRVHRHPHEGSGPKKKRVAATSPSKSSDSSTLKGSQDWEHKELNRHTPLFVFEEGVVYSNPSTIIIFQNPFTGKTDISVATCDPRDSYNKETGYSVARLKMFKKVIEDGLELYR